MVVLFTVMRGAFLMIVADMYKDNPPTCKKCHKKHHELDVICPYFEYKLSDFLITFAILGGLVLIALIIALIF